MGVGVLGFGVYGFEILGIRGLVFGSVLGVGVPYFCFCFCRFVVSHYVILSECMGSVFRAYIMFRGCLTPEL